MTVATGGVVSTGGTFDPGETSAASHGTIGTLTITGSLTLDSNSVLNMDMGPTCDTITVSGVMTAAGTINVYAIPGFAGHLGLNTYNLVTYGTLSGSSSLVLGSQPNTTGSLLAYSGGSNGISAASGKVSLAITRTAGTYVWTGGDGTSYTDWNDPANWNQGVLAPYGTNAGNTDIAQFNLSGNPVVSLASATPTPSGTYYPGTVQIYTISLNGAGTLTLTSPSGSIEYLYGGLTVAANQTVQGNAFLTLQAPMSVSGTLAGTFLLSNLSGGGSLVSTGGTFSPGWGAAGPGHTAGTFTSDLTSTFDSNTTFNLNLGIDAAHSDQIVINGTATLGGAKIDLYNMGTMAAGNYRLLTYAQKANLSDTVALGILPAGYTTANTALIAYPTFVSFLAGSTAYNWTAGTGPANWSLAGNWGGTSYPGTAPATDVANIALGSNPTITMNAAQTVAALQMTGAGTLTINGVNALTVANGIAVSNNQALDGNGRIDGSIYLYDSGSATAAISGSLSVTGNVGYAPGGFGGEFAPGTGGNGSGHTAGTIAITGSLDPSGMFNNNTQWNFNLGSLTNFDKITVSGTAALAGLVNIYNSSGLSTIPIGDYHILQYASLGGYVPGGYFSYGSVTGGSLNYAGTVNTYPSGYSASNMVLAVSPTFVDVNVGGTQYTWSGTSGNWNDPTKWGGVSYPGFAATDVAKIALAANTTTTITLNGAYTVPILMVSGTGTLVLSSGGNSGNALTVTDGIFMDPGSHQTIKAGAGGAYINASIMMGGIVAVLGDTTGANTTYVTGDVYMNIGGSSGTTLANTTINGNLFIGNNYSLTNSSITGNVSAYSLTAYVGNNGNYANLSAAAGSTLALSSGTVTVKWTETTTWGTTNSLSVPAALTLALGSAAGNITLVDNGTGYDYVWLYGTITGSNGLTIAGSATSTNPDIVAIGTGFNATGLSGTLTIGGGGCGTVVMDDIPGGGAFAKNLVLNLAGNGTFQSLGSGVETFGGLTGSGTFDIEAVSTAGLTIDTSNGGGPYVFNGTLTGGLTAAVAPYTLTKAGSGTQVLGSNVSLSGGSWLNVNVAGGELTVNGTVAAASVAVLPGATLDGAGTVTGPLAVSGGTLGAGLSVVATGASSISGSPTVNSNLTVSSGTLTMTGTAGGSGNWTVANGSTLTTLAFSGTGGMLGGSGTLTVNTGGTVSGNGSISNPVTLAGGRQQQGRPPR